MGLIEIRTVKITEKGQIAIPKDIRDLEGFQDGTKIALLAYDDHVELRPLDRLKTVSLAKEENHSTLASEKAMKNWLVEDEDNTWKDL